MPTYAITDPQSGRTLEFDGPAPPSEAVIRQAFAQLGGVAQAAAPAEAPPQGSALSRFAGGAAEMLNPITAVQGIAQMVAHPIDTAKAIGSASLAQAEQAKAAYDRGDYGTAALRAGASVPIIGPLAADIAEQAQGGDYAGAAGRAVGLVAGPKVFGAMAKAPGAVVRGAARAARGAVTAAPEVADAARWALEQGIPVDAATASGNKVARAAKWAADSSVGGAVPGMQAATARGEALARTGRGLAAKVAPEAATAETAGGAVREGVEGVIKAQDEAATQAYGKVRAAERAAQPDEVPVSQKQVTSPVVEAEGRPITRTETITEAQKLAVPLAGVKDALRPVLDRLMRKKELTGTLMGDEGRAAVALDAIVSGADHAPLSVVDAALSDLKAAARGAALPELRTSGQGVAAQAVKELETALQARAKAAGVWDDLRAGRDATIAKWTAADTLDKLRAEPVQTFRMLTQGGDAAIAKLREVVRLAPAEVPKIGRAWLEDALDTATAEGGFGREAKIWADWQRLGDETKALLYPDPNLRAALDKFFLIGKKLAENPNPSGSALVGGLSAQGFLTLIDPVTSATTAIGGYALSKLLNSPKIARLLVEGMQTPKTAPTAASIAARLRAALRAVPKPSAGQSGAAGAVLSRQTTGQEAR